MMLGLIKPTSGKVIIKGKNVENENDRIKILEKMNMYRISYIRLIISPLSSLIRHK